jgi:hypothetical protein
MEPKWIFLLPLNDSTKIKGESNYESTRYHEDGFDHDRREYPHFGGTGYHEAKQGQAIARDEKR